MFVMFLSLILIFAGFTSAQDKDLENLKQTGQAFRSVARKVSPTIVFIKVEKEIGSSGTTEYDSPIDNPFGDEFFRRFFGTRPQLQQPQF